MNRWKSFRAALMLTLLTLVPVYAPAQQPAQKGAVDFGAFTKEIMLLRFDGPHQNIVMWLPYEFFVAAGTADGTPKETVERNLSFLKPFITVMVMTEMERPDGSSVYATKGETLGRAAIRLDDGTEVRPLEVVPPTIAALVSQMQALIAKQGGTDRENMHIVVFPAQTAQGRTVVDVARREKLTLTLNRSGNFNAATFTWRTPFDALTTVPDCPRCKAGLSAKWSHCPYCGQKISN